MKPRTLEEIDREVGATVAVPKMVAAEQIADILEISERHFRRLVHDGIFPRPLRLGNCSRWPATDVVGYVERLRLQREKTKRGR